MSGFLAGVMSIPAAASAATSSTVSNVARASGTDNSRRKPGAVSSEVREIRAIVGSLFDEVPQGEVPPRVTAFFSNHRKELKGEAQKHDSPVQVAKQDEKYELPEDLKSLSPSFFTQDFQAFEHVLKGYPKKAGRDDQEIFMMENLALYKTQQDVVNRELLQIVQENHSELFHGMRQVQSIDLELAKAAINVKNARRRLNLAKEGLVQGDLRVVQLYRRRARAKQLIETFQNLSQLVERRRKIEELQDVPTAVNLCVETLVDLRSEPWSTQPHFRVLDELEENLLKALPRLRKRTDQTLRTAIATKYVFESTSYEHVVHSYMLLDRAIEAYIPRNRIAKLFGLSSGLHQLSDTTGIDGISELAVRVQRLVISLAEDALKEELVNYMGDIETKRRHEKEIAADADPLASDVSRAMTLKEVCEALPARESIRPSFVSRVALALETVCELLFKYHTIASWHVSYKHLENDAKHVVERFEKLAHDVEKGRRAVWSGVLDNISTVAASKAARYPGLRVHAFENLVKVVDIMASVSQAFGGDTCVLEARAFIRQMCKTYCDDFNRDTFEVLNSFMGRELWTMINVPLSALGGIDGLLSRGTDKQLLRSNSSRIDAKSIHTVHEKVKASVARQSMHTLSNKGNPFRVIRDTISQGNTQSADGAALALGLVDEAADDDEEEVEEFSAEGNAVASISLEGKAAAQDESARGGALTSTLVNCVAKSVGSCVVLMEHIPTVAADTLVTGLQGICNLYMYNLMTNLVPIDLLLQIFHVPATTKARHYSVFQSCMLSTAKRHGAGFLKVTVAPELVDAQDSTTGSREKQSRFNFLARNRNALSKKRQASPPKGKTAPKPGSSTARSAAVPVKYLETKVPARLVQLVHQWPLNKDGSARLEAGRDMSNVTDANMVAWIVAGESLFSVLDLVDGVRERVEEALPAIERAQVLAKVYKTIERTASDLRQLIFIGVARMLVDKFSSDSFSSNADRAAQTTTETGGGVICVMVHEVQWGAINKMKSEASQYVKKVTLRMRKVWSHLQRNSKEGSAYPLATITSLWDATICECFEQILSGFSAVQTCSTEGRMLMTLDVATLFSNIQEIAPCGDSGTMAKERVNDYIKAHFLDREQDLLEWVRGNHSRFEVDEMTTLALSGIGAKLSATNRSKLEQAVSKTYLEAAQR